jgi:hypothetical protein
MSGGGDFVDGERFSAGGRHTAGVQAFRQKDEGPTLPG